MEELGSTQKDNQQENKNEKGRLIPRQLRYAVSTTLVLLALLGISVAFVLRVFFMTESACYDDLLVETEDAISTLETNLRSDRTMLRVIAGLIGNVSDIDSIEASGYLANYDVNSQITQIGILLPGNEVLSSNGRRSNTDGTLNFDEISVLSDHISATTSLRGNSSVMLLRNYVPIRKDGITIGMIFSTANSSSVAKAWLPNIYDKKGYCFVVDRKTGDIMINTSSENIKNIKDIDFSQTESLYTKEDTINDILDGKKGYSVFGSETASDKMYMCHLPFSIEDWEMVVLVPEEAVFSSVAPVRSGMYMLFGAVALIMLIYVAWLIREIRISIAEAEKRANIDVLTDLPNRNRYEAYLKTLEGSAEKLVCLFIDANGLHELNNTKGHFAGDQMLRFIADTLKVQFGGEHIYRIGGDEFIVFLSDITQEKLDEGLSNFAEALQRNDYHAAVGTGVFGSGMSVDQLIKDAEKEMYEAKRKYYDEIGKVMRV